MARRTIRRRAVSIIVPLLLLTSTLALSAERSTTQPEKPTFFIAGHVATPGSYPWSDGLTVARGVALAGGYDDRGSKDDLQIQRMIDGQLTSFVVTEDDPVQPADVIMVRAASRSPDTASARDTPNLRAGR